KNQYIHILPNKGTPYTIANGGGFEVNTDDFGINHSTGTTWERGSSAVAGKQGTHAGANAWVTGLVGNYVDNSRSILMTPNYNFTLPGAYTLSFWSRSNTESDYDGFRVEYTTNKGGTWLPLGTTVAAGWYNSANVSGTTIFPANEAFFSGNRGAAYTQSTRDVSFLAGNPNVAFRIVFASDGGVTGVGAAVDDFEIAGPPNIALPVTLTSFRAYKQGADVMVDWKTENETNIREYKVERSTDGASFTEIGTVQARSGTVNTYQFTDRISQLSTRPTGNIYYRLRIHDFDAGHKYSTVARITLDAAATITVGPNPFADYLNIYTSAAIKRVTLFDMNGREMYSTAAVVGNKVMISRTLPTGTYLARIETTSGTETLKVYKGE
ncbi:MAG: T9SS type A sorting domain-containing protein, partial [Chitinophagaceae bacterium]|nr:T9SS type A sorting domain-containing protein [Chitinophagaceae bacterium]